MIDKCQLTAEVFSVLMNCLGLTILCANQRSFLKIFFAVTFLMTGIIATLFTISVFYYFGLTCI